ncbi:MAG: urease accessory protein UreD [Phyllobacterium sp.]
MDLKLSEPADILPGNTKPLPASFDAGSSAHWKAELELWFDKMPQCTRLARRRHLGPLLVQRPFYPESDGTCHVYLLHPPGGIAAGDELNFTLHVGENARCVLTTPGATKFYRMSSGKAVQRCTVEVGRSAVCEYLPQETIIFNGANTSIDTRVSLQGDATYVGWDFICLGRPAAGERFDTGAMTQRVEIVRDGTKIWFERYRLVGGSPLQDAVYAFSGQPVFGTMIYAGPLRDGLAEAVQQAVGDSGGKKFSVSQLEHIVVCRYLGPQAEEGKILFTRAWNALRMALQSKPASAPRIWAT